jgi:hypothetical protein
VGRSAGSRSCTIEKMLAEAQRDASELKMDAMPRWIAHNVQRAQRRIGPAAVLLLQSAVELATTPHPTIELTGADKAVWEAVQLSASEVSVACKQVITEEAALSWTQSVGFDDRKMPHPYLDTVAKL